MAAETTKVTPLDGSLIHYQTIPHLVALRPNEPVVQKDALYVVSGYGALKYAAELGVRGVQSLDVLQRVHKGQLPHHPYDDLRLEEYHATYAKIKRQHGVDAALSWLQSVAVPLSENGSVDLVRSLNVSLHGLRRSVAKIQAFEYEIASSYANLFGGIAGMLQRERRSHRHEREISFSGNCDSLYGQLNTRVVSPYLCAVTAVQLRAIGQESIASRLFDEVDLSVERELGV